MERWLRQGRKCGKSAAMRAGRARSKGPAGGSQGSSRTARPARPPCRQAATARARSVGVRSVAAARSRYRARVEAVSPEPGWAAARRTASCHRVRPADGVDAGGEEGVGAGRRLGGEQVQRERVGRAGRVRDRPGGRPGWRGQRGTGAAGPGAGGRRASAGPGLSAWGGGRALVRSAADRAALRRDRSARISCSPRPRIRKQHERVLVEQPGRLVAEGGRVLAGVTVVGAGAVGDQVAGRGQQVRRGRPARAASPCRAVRRCGRGGPPPRPGSPPSRRRRGSAAGSRYGTGAACCRGRTP